MTCESARNLVEAHLDGELDPSLSAQIAEHMAACPACTEEHGRLVTLRTGIRTQALYYPAPARLREQVGAALGRAGRQAVGLWRAIAIAASVLLAVSLAWNAVQIRTRHSPLTQDVLASHIRSLMANHLTDVASSDQHTVKPWFNGRLDYSPDVKDFAAAGFPLLGGRLDYIDGRAVAALVYRRHQHIINVFTWPTAEPPHDSDLSRNGYHALHWSRAGMTYWAVSDLAAGELQQFANLYKR